MSDPDPDPGRKQPSTSVTRIVIWVFVAGVGLYLLGSGVIGLLID